MSKSFYVSLSVLVLLALYAPSVSPTTVSVMPLNPFVLQATQAYQDGSYPYLLNDDYANYNGVTRDIEYQGQILLRANSAGDHSSYCVGITFEVLFTAMQERNRQLGLPVDYSNGMRFADMQDFILDWYAAKGPKSVSNIGIAVENYGIGQRIFDLESALSGDFIDFMRDNGSGHTAVFLHWVRDDDQIIGFRYWSSQASTDGIGVNTEYFAITRPAGGQYGNVKHSSIVIARIVNVDDYRPYRISSPWDRLHTWIRGLLQWHRAVGRGLGSLQTSS